MEQYRILIKKSVSKDFKKIPKKDAKRILDAMGFEKTDELLPPEAPADPKSEAEIAKMLGDNAASQGESPEPTDGVQAATAGMGNSNPQGMNQYQG